MFTLDERLKLCADLVRDGARLADIGTDHAFLPVRLLYSGRIESAIASDINPLPLESGRKNARKYGVEKIEFRLGTGLSTLRAEDGVTDIVIAGMGGELISKILSESELTRDRSLRLILQPMTRSDELIDYLTQNGYKITEQRCTASKGKSYTVICAVYTGEKTACDELYRYTGKLDLSDEESRRFLERHVRNLENKSRGDISLVPLLNKLKEKLYENSGNN